MYLLRDGGESAKNEPRVQLFGSGAILREVLAGAELLENDWNVRSDVWSVTSFNELQRDGVAARRWNMLHPQETPRRSFVEESLQRAQRPRHRRNRLHPHVCRADSPVRRRGRYATLGTDGYGRSDYRRKLREFFEVNRHFVAIAALKALAEEGQRSAATVGKALEKVRTSIPNKPNPITV